MTFISDNVIPGNHGKKFTTDVNATSEQSKVKAVLMTVEGVIDVIFSRNVHPIELTVHTNKVVHIAELQDKVKALEYHIIAKGPFFPLF